MKALAFSQLLRAITFKKIRNFLSVECSFFISKILQKSIVWGRPYIFTIEPSSLCNLNCPLCAVGAKRLTRPQGLLDLRIYQKMVNEVGDYLFEILLFNQGEPFLHPQLADFVKLAKAKKIYTTISTNGHFLTGEEALSKIIKSGLDVLNVSLDGATAEIFQQYRRGGKFQQVLTGIRQLQQMKKTLNSRTPRLFIQFLVTRQNENELPAIRKLARQLGADRLLLKTLQVENQQEAAQYLPVGKQYRRYDLSNGTLQLKRRSIAVCSRLWRSSVLLSDGKVVSCCFDKNGDYILGDYSKKNDFLKIWQGHEYSKLRNKSLQKRTPGQLCANCTEGIQIYR